jgi:hypothetical protein
MAFCHTQGITTHHIIESVELRAWIQAWQVESVEDASWVKVWLVWINRSYCAGFRPGRLNHPEHKPIWFNQEWDTASIQIWLAESAENITRIQVCLGSQRKGVRSVRLGQQRKKDGLLSVRSRQRGHNKESDLSGWVGRRQNKLITCVRLSQQRTKQEISNIKLSQLRTK